MSARRKSGGYTADELTRRRFLGLGLSGAVLLGAGPTLLTACGGDDDEPATSPGSAGGGSSPEELETLKVGVISTYTGIAGFVGDITKRSLVSATKYLDANGGIGGRRAELVERDIAGPEGIPQPSLAVQAVQEFVDDPDVVGILWCAPVNGLAEVLADVDDVGIPFISVFADLWSDNALYPDISTADDLPDVFQGLELRSVFQIFLPDRMAIELLADYCKDDRQFESAGMIYDTIVYPRAGDWWKAAMDRVGLEQAGLEAFTMLDSEYGQQVQRLQAAGGDALFVWGLSSNTAGVVKQIDAVGGAYVDRETAMSGWAPQIMGSPGGTGERGWVDLAGKSARPGSLTVWYVGGLIGLPDFPIRDMLADAGYDFPTGGEEAPADALAALLRAVEEADSTDPDDMVEALESGIEIQFASSIPFTFSEDRHLSKEQEDLILITLERPPENPPYKLGKEFGTTFPADYEGPVSLNDFTLEENRKKYNALYEGPLMEGYGTWCAEQRQGDQAEACRAVH